MNINDPRHPWSRLTAAARNVANDRDTTAPYGFATRVAALGFSQERKTTSLIEVLALRALGVAALLVAFSIAMNYQALISPAPSTQIVANDEAILPTVDAVAIVLGAD